MEAWCLFSTTLTRAFFFEAQVPQAVFDFGGHFLYPHPFLHHEFAGKCCPSRSALPEIVRDPAILAILIPTKAPVGDIVRRQVLQAAQERIVLRNLKLPASNGDFDQPGKGTEKRGRSAHAPAILFGDQPFRRNRGSCTDGKLNSRAMRFVTFHVVRLMVLHVVLVPGSGPRSRRQ